MADTLPLEVLSNIFKFLSVSDRKQSALVCRRWYDATLDPYLQKDVVFRVMPSATEYDYDSSGSLSHRKGVHLAVSTLDDGLASCSPQLLHRLSSHVCSKLVGLSIRGADLTESSFAGFISRCTNLVSLSVAYCDSLVMAGTTLAKCLATVSLPSLKDLDLSHMRHLSDQTLTTFMQICPRLECLRLAANSIVFKSSRLYYDPQRADHRPSGGVLTFACVLDALALKASTLRRLDLSATAVDDASLAELAALGGLRLDELSLVACRELSNAGLAALCARQGDLHSLDLSQAAGLVEGFAAPLAAALPRLRRLALTKCAAAVTSAAARSLIGGLRELESLSLSGCHRLDDSGFFAAAAVRAAPGGLGGGGEVKPLLAAAMRLSRLDLSYCGLIGDRVVVSACSLLGPRLTHLDLTSCIQLTDAAAAAIARQLPGLAFLSLAWCKEISDYGVMGVAAPPDHDHTEVGACKCQRDASGRVPFASFPPVRYIAPALMPPSVDELERAKAAAEAADGPTGGPPASFANLSRLVTLRLAACTRLSDASLAVCLRYVELRDLDLDLCHGVTDVTLLAVAAHNPSLERLSVAQCGGITDDGVAAVVRQCRRLARLNLSGCGRVTARSLDAIAAAAPLSLRELDVSLCNVAARLVDVLQAALPTLRVVHKRHTGCDPATD